MLLSINKAMHDKKKPVDCNIWVNDCLMMSKV